MQNNADAVNELNLYNICWLQNPSILAQKLAFCLGCTQPWGNSATEKLGSNGQQAIS